MPLWPWSRSSAVAPITSLPNPLYTPPSSSSSATTLPLASNAETRLLQEQYKQFLADRKNPIIKAGLPHAVINAMEIVKGPNAISRTKPGKFWGSTTRNNANVQKNMKKNVKRFALLKEALSDPENPSYNEEAADYFDQVARKARGAVENANRAMREEAERAEREHREAEEAAAAAEAEAAAAREAEEAAEGLSREEKDAAEAASKKTATAAAAATAAAIKAAKAAALAKYEQRCAADAASCSLENVRNERTRRAILGTGPVYIPGNTKNFSNSNVSKIRAQLLKEYPRNGMNATSYYTKLQDMLYTILSRGSWDALPNAELRKKIGTYRQSLTGPTNLTRKAIVERVFRMGANGAIGVANPGVPRLSGSATAAAAAAEAAVAAASKTLKERESTNLNSGSTNLNSSPFNSGRSEEAEQLNSDFVNVTRGLTPKQRLNAALAEERARRAAARPGAAARRGSGVASTVQSGLASRLDLLGPGSSFFTGTRSRPSSASSSANAASSLANAIRAGQQRHGSIFDSARPTSGTSASRRGSMSSQGSRASSQGRPAFGTAARVASIHNKGVGMGNAAAQRRAAAKRGQSQQVGQTKWLNPLFGYPPPIPPTEQQKNNAARRKIASAALSRGFALPPLQSRAGMGRPIQQELAQQQNALKRAQALLGTGVAAAPAGENEAAAELGEDEEEIFSSNPPGLQLPASPIETSQAPSAPVTAWQNGTVEEELGGGRRRTYRRKGSRGSKGKGKSKGKSKRRSRK